MKKCNRLFAFALALPLAFMSCDKSIGDITPDDILSIINPSGAEDTSDTDGDGITDYDEIYKYFTDPSNVDTDGDGWTDYEERTMYTEGSNTFNPLIADVPKLEVQFTTKPEVAFKYTVDSSTTVSDSLTTSSGTVHSTTINSSDTTTQEQSHGWGVTIGAAYKWGFGTGATNEFTLSGEAHYEGSVTKGDSFTYSKEQSEEFSTSIENGHTREESSGKTVDGGVIKVLAKFKNPSSIAYNVNSVTVTITAISDYRDGSTPGPITSYEFTNVGTIAPNSETGEFTLEADLTIDETEKLLKWSSGMNLNIAGYTITLTKDGETKDFTGELTRVRAQTAMLSIDYGPGSTNKNEKHLISTKNKYNTEATSISNLYKPVSIQELLEVAKISTDNLLELGNGGRIKAIRGVEHISYLKGTWFIGHTYTRNNETRTTIYSYEGEPPEGVETDISKIYVQAGDSVTIFYNVDKDNDGVPYNEELLYGTDDNTEDTDGDGLTDLEEIYGWIPSEKFDDLGLDLTEYITDEHKLKTIKVFSNPVIKDTDGDDIPDNTDPNPVSPKQKDDTSLIETKYKISNTDSFKSLQISNNSCSISVETDNIYLNFVPKTLFETVKYRLSENSMYTDLSSTEPIPLYVGNNKIDILVTAADGITKRNIVLNVTSKFKKLDNLVLTSSDYNGGNVSFTFDPYTDTRVLTSGDDCGIILHIVNPDTNYKEPDYNTNSFSEIIENAISSLETNNASSRNFWVKLIKDELKEKLKKGNFLLTGLKSQTPYSIYAYAYYKINGELKFAPISTANVTTAKDKTGTFTFWAHYLYEVESKDNNTSPDYFWTFTTGESLFDGITELNVPESQKVEFKNDKHYYYCFGEKTSHGSNEPARYGNCSKKFSKAFDRSKAQSFSLSLNIQEYDSGSPNDNLGTATINFVYVPSNDTWGITWNNPGTDSSSTYVTWTPVPSEQNAYFTCDDGRVRFYFGMRWSDE